MSSEADPFLVLDFVVLSALVLVLVLAALVLWPRAEAPEYSPAVEDYRMEVQVPREVPDCLHPELTNASYPEYLRCLFAGELRVRGAE